MDWSPIRGARDGRPAGRACLCRRRNPGCPVVASGTVGNGVVQVMSFDTLAPHYRWMEFILAGKKLQRCRTAFLDEIPTGLQRIRARLILWTTYAFFRTMTRLPAHNLTTP